MPYVGWDKKKIQLQAKKLAMFGYGQWHHRAKSFQTELYARSIVIAEENQTPIIFCCLDIGCITYAMRERAVKQLEKFDWFDQQRLLLTATHTHSGPGGCAYEALYNMPTPGFVPEHVDAIVDAIVKSICTAVSNQAETEVRYGQSRLDDDIPVAWNRSVVAYNLNPEVQQRSIDDTHLALDRLMNVVGFYRQGHLHALISLFGVHATCLGNSLHKYDGDNKGYAAGYAEEHLIAQGIDHPVAIFAQATAGDVSPHFHGTDQLKIRKTIRGDNEYLYAKKNGKYQSDAAFDALMSADVMSLAHLDGIYQYIDLSCVEVDPQFSHGKIVTTSQPCHGASFFSGTPVDGLGTAKPISFTMSLLSKRLRRARLKPNHPEHAYYQALYASQGNKDIVLEAGRKLILGHKIEKLPHLLDPLVAEMSHQVKAGAIKESLLVPEVVPIQLLLLGEMCLIGCPGEITTIAGKRLVNSVKAAMNSTVKQVLLVSYCNDYMGYITTCEEYQQQAYEGGHTLYGQWTLAAFQTRFKALAEQFILPISQRVYEQAKPHIPPADELMKRTNFGSVKTAVKNNKDK